MLAAASREFDGIRLVAGHPALDFVNSVKYRGQSNPGDRIADYAAAVAWSEVAGIIDAKTAATFRSLGGSNPKAGHEAYLQLLEMREALCQLLPHSAEGPEKRASAEERIHALLAEVANHRRIDPETIALVPDLPVEEPGDLKLWIGFAIQDLLSRDTTRRIGCCEGSDCDWVFVEGGRGRARRWCDSRTCGNAARVREHRRKQQPGTEQQ